MDSRQLKTTLSEVVVMRSKLAVPSGFAAPLVYESRQNMRGGFFIFIYIYSLYVLFP